MRVSDYDPGVIGSGSAGQKGAIATAKARKRVALIDRIVMIGSVCVHTGTIPSKTLREDVFQFNLRLVVASGFFWCALAASGQTPPPAPQPDMLQQKIQQIEQMTAKNEQQLHTYQWIEATTLTIDGTPRPPKRSICRYAADGTMLKTPLGPQEAGMSGQMRGGPIRKHIAEEKKEKIQDEVKQIHALTQLYLPLNPVKFKEVLSTGKVNLEHDGANGDSVIFNDDAKPGDQLRLTLNRTTMQIDRISVKTYFDNSKDLMTVDIRFSILADGTMYPALTSIELPSKKLSIATVNSDFSKAVY